MIPTFLLSVLSSVSFAPPAPPPAALVLQEEDPAVVQKITEAGTDVAKLVELAAAFEKEGKDDAVRKVYTKVLEIDPNHEAAHKALRHHNYDGKWFTSYAELSKYRREEAKRMKDEKGLVRFNDQWVPEADLPYLRMQWVKGEDGTWMNPNEVERQKQMAEFKSKSYEFRGDDNSWIAPEDKDKWVQNLWKCGEEWLPMDQANAYHSQMGQWWQLAGEHFIVWTTCEWEGGNWARWYGDLIYPELVRIFGVEPKQKPHFVVLNSFAQYNEAAGGNPPVLPDSEGFSSLHHSYFADMFFNVGASGAPEYLGCGVGFWDRKDEKLGVWGPYSLRFAAAQSFVDAIDPSFLAISEAISAGASGGQATPGAFWTEKKVPRWLRYGAASYVERYLKDPEAQEGTNPWRLRDFAFSDLSKRGGLRKVEEVIAFPLNLEDIDASTKLYFEAGLLVSYMLDGDPKETAKLREKHEAFKAALKSGKDVPKAVDELQQELVKSENEIRKYAGL